jgi:hypothetical protein
MNASSIAALFEDDALRYYIPFKRSSERNRWFGHELILSTHYRICVAYWPYEYGVGFVTSSSIFERDASSRIFCGIGVTMSIGFLTLLDTPFVACPTIRSFLFQTN